MIMGFFVCFVGLRPLVALVIMTGICTYGSTDRDFKWKINVMYIENQLFTRNLTRYTSHVTYTSHALSLQGCALSLCMDDLSIFWSVTCHNIC